MSFRSVMAAGQDWRHVLRAAIDQVEPLATPAGLGIAYLAGPVADMSDVVLAALRQRSGIRSWLGVGVGAVLGPRGGAGLAALVAPLPAAGFRVFSGGSLPAGAWPAALVHGEPVLDGSGDPALFTGTPDTMLVGGLVQGSGGIVQMDRRLIVASRAGIAFSPHQAVLCGLVPGCRPIGPPRRVAYGLSGELARLDGRPALSVMHDAYGDVLSRDPARLRRQLFIGAPAVGPGEHAHRVRRIFEVDETSGSLRHDGERLGTAAQLMLPDPRGALDRLRGLAQDL